MGQRFCVNKVSRIQGNGRMVFGVFLLMAAVLFAGQAMAFTFDFLGKKMSVNGYVNQSLQFGVTGDHYETMSGFQQALMQALLEVDYKPADDVKVFVSGQLTKDWAYDILDSDDDWKFRRFDEARDEMSLRDDYEDVLKECHVTWTPGNANIRLGKQILVWGRMDGYRIMDQINPLDGRLGPSDVEFETSIVPIWLAKFEYFPDYLPGFLNDLGFEVVFNPNADFIANKKPYTGNDEYGIWSARATNPPNPLAPTGMRVMSEDGNVDEPDRWDSDGYEYAFRIKGTLSDATYFTLNFFDGVNNDPILRSRYGEGHLGLAFDFDDYFDDKGRQIIHPLMEGYYPDQTFAGFTFARDLEGLYIKSLGGVAPLLRGEFTYEFDATFFSKGAVVPFSPPWPAKEYAVESDVIYAGLGLEWKLKWNLINSRRYISIMPQFGYKHIKDYPDVDKATGRPITLTGALGADEAENLYQIFISMYTYYLHDKLMPGITFLRDVRSDVGNQTRGSYKKDLWIFNLKYSPNERWLYKMRLSLFEGQGYKASGVDRYDNISFTVQYSF